MPFVLDDTEVNLPVYTEREFPASTSPSAKAAAPAFKGRKPRKLSVGHRIPELEFRLRLLQDSVIRARMEEIVQSLRSPSAKPGSAPSRRKAKGKKYSTLSPDVQRELEGICRK